MDKKVNEKSQNTSKGKYGISVVLKTIFIVLIANHLVCPVQ